MADGSLPYEDPMRIGITHKIGARRKPRWPDEHPDRGVTVPAALIPALLEALQLTACCAKQRQWASHPRAEEFMERDTGRKGWRAYLDQEETHLFNVVEDIGLAVFIEEDES